MARTNLSLLKKSESHLPVFDEGSYERAWHDLKSPISMLRCLADESREGAPVDSILLGAAVDRLDAILKSVDRRPNTGQSQSVSLGEFRAAAVRLVESKNLEFNNEVKVVYEDDGDFNESLKFKGDMNEWLRLLSNLINNSRDAYHSAGKVILELKSKGDELLLKVCDRGCGIPNASLGRLGKKYYTTKACGQGLGLFFGKMFVEALGGSFGVFSKFGHGTTVEIRLPTMV